MQVHFSNKALLAVAMTASVAATGSASAQVEVNGAGATLFVDFFLAPASTNDFIDVDGNGVFGFDSNNFSLQQLAGGAAINPTTGAVSYNTAGVNTDYMAHQYRSVGSVRGIDNWAQYQINGVLPTTLASEEQFINRTIYAQNGAVTYGPQNGATTVNPIAAPYASGMADPLGRTYDQIDYAFSDVPLALATQNINQPAGSQNWNRRPSQAGYGVNPIASSDTGFVSELPSLAGIGATQNFIDNATSTAAAWVPVNYIANRGAGVENVRVTELQHLFTTGRMDSGENLMAVTRDFGSGTRNAAMNSIGVDPSWGRGDNIGDRTNVSSTELVGENFQPTNKGGSSRMEGTVQNARLAVGYTGFAGGSRSVADAIAGRYEILNTMNDHVGGTLYVRPTVDSVLDNADVDTGYRIGGNGSFITAGNPFFEDVDYSGGGVIGKRINPGADGVFNPASDEGAVGGPVAAGDDFVEDAPWEVGDGVGQAMANPDARDFIRNIFGSIDGFVAAPAADANQNMPGQFLAFTFFLADSVDAVATDSDPTTFAATGGDGSSLQNFVRTSQKAIRDTPGFGTVNGSGLVSTRLSTPTTDYTDAQAIIDSAAGTASDVNTVYVTADGTLVGYGQDLSVVVGSDRNRIAGDFDGDFDRDVNDIDDMVDAFNARGTGAARQAWATARGVTAAGDANDAVFEILGDFNADGNFDEEDIRYYADGLTLVNGQLDRTAGFTAVDNAAGGDFFGYGTHVTGKTYAAGDARGDIAGSGLITAGFAPNGADGSINAVDIDYLFDQFVNNSFVTDGEANWSNLDEAVGFDLSADMTGDLIVNDADVDELVREILGTEYGDANLDGLVNISDLTILGANFGQGGGWALGDFTGDGLINISDLTLLGQFFGFGTTSGPSFAEALQLTGLADEFAAIPEPTTLTLLMGLGVLGVMRRRRA